MLLYLQSISYKFKLRMELLYFNILKTHRTPIHKNTSLHTESRKTQQITSISKIMIKS